MHLLAYVRECKEAVYTKEELKDAEFFIADSKDSIISDKIELDTNDGVEVLPWTLNAYIAISNMKYSGKASLRKGKIISHCTVTGEELENRVIIFY